MVGWARAGKCRRVALGAQPQSHERQCAKFAIGLQILIFLKALQGVNRVWAPLPIWHALEVTALAERLLDFLVAVR